jgi:predicted ATP-binding protein involved in virulence
MNISQIEIFNYKGFENTTVSFHPRMNVFIGSNGAGKTSLLQTLIKTLFNVTRSFTVPPGSNSALSLELSDIRHTANYSVIINHFNFPNYTLPVSVFATSPNPNNLPANFLSHLADITSKNQDFFVWLQSQIRTSPLSIPIIKFYPANRVAIKNIGRGPEQGFSIPQLEAWSNIFQNDVSYSKFFRWFLQQETNELFIQRDAQDFTIESGTLRDVRLALQIAFQELGYQEARIKSKQIPVSWSSELVPTLVLENIATREEESLDQKSDGEKSIISLVADIAYNLSIGNNFSQTDHFLSNPGIVIIDEIETHLHPNWQRQILPILTNVFPNIQFFVATHSPQVVSSVKSESVFVCENFNVQSIHLKTLGQDSNSLLKYVFDSTDRPFQYIDVLERFDQALSKNKNQKQLESILEEIKRLEEEDDSQNISGLINNLILKIESYKFDQDYEKDH